jgi:signal transduction histidine kinase
MSYRSFKRVLGETNLERKCRLLFGCCLLLLITGSFWWSGRRLERSFHDQMQRAGHDFVDSIMLKIHTLVWHEKQSQNEQDPDVLMSEALLHEMIRDLQTQKYTWDLISLQPGSDRGTIPDMWSKDPVLPQNEGEKRLLLQLQSQYASHITELRLQEGEDLNSAATNPPEQDPHRSPVDSTQDIDPVSYGSWVREKNNYYYYQPVYWKQSCIGCHPRAHPDTDATLNANPELAGLPPFSVVKVTIPDRRLRTNINWTRAVLSATAIVTASVAMAAMYLIVKYVVVKPLRHLRDVSDEVTRGNTELRAEIHTNDEFEELATAFNRMLRSLSDGQNDLKQLNRSLDAKVDELAQANLKLYEMNRLKGDFLANMSHELRTPLNSIIGFSDVLQGIDILNDKQRRYVQNIQHSGRLLLDMINDILDLAKMESGKMELRYSEFQVDAIVKAQCDLMRSLTEEKNISLDVSVSKDLPVMYQDQSKVQQVLTNLLSNAIKFTPEGGRITVSANKTPKEQLELYIADTGVGIAEEDREIVFEKFRQGTPGGTNNLTRAYSGTGLGLSIVKELCKLMGGDVSFESDLGKGSTFSVRLPWRGVDKPQRNSSMKNKLDDLTNPYRMDFGRNRNPTNPDDLATDESATETESRV